MSELLPQSILQVFETRVQTLEQSGDVDILYRENDVLDDPFYIVQLVEYPLVKGDDFASVEFSLGDAKDSLTLVVLAGGRESHPGIENMCHRLHLVGDNAHTLGGAIFNSRGLLVRYSNLFGSMTPKASRTITEQFITFRSKMV